MSENVNRNYILTLLERLLRTPSPTGFCGAVIELLRVEAEKLGLAWSYTNKGNGRITVSGASSGPAIAITAHADTLGAMVRSVKPSGTLRLTPVGGYMMGSIENEYCLVHTRDGRTYSGTIMTTHPSVHVFSDARDWKREEANMEIRLDEPIQSKQDVQKLGIRTGDFISFDPRVQIMENGYVKSRHLDDKAGIAAVFGLLELLTRTKTVPARPLEIIVSTYEEVSHGGSSLPASVSEVLAVDMGAIGDDLGASEQDVSICAKDSSGPYDYRMVSRLIELAERGSIRYSVDIYPNYGSDASAALRGGNDVRGAVLGPAVHASHGMERTHLDAIAGTTALLAAYVMEPAAAYGE